MFTPKEIRDTEFERIVRGYNPEDVDGFLAQLADQMEQLVSEKEEAEKKARDASSRMDSYREDGDALRSVLVTAEKMKTQMLAEAKETSEKLLGEATERAEKLIADAQQQSDSIVGEIASKVSIEEATLRTLKKQVSDFKSNVLDLYKKHLETLSDLPEYEEEEPRVYHAPAEPAHAVEAQPALPAEPETAAEPIHDEVKADTTAEFAFPEFGGEKPSEVRETPQADAFSFSSDEGERGNRFGKLDFGDSFTFGAE